MPLALAKCALSHVQKLSSLQLAHAYHAQPASGNFFANPDTITYSFSRDVLLQLLQPAGLRHPAAAETERGSSQSQQAKLWKHYSNSRQQSRCSNRVTMQQHCMATQPW
jgi:hypothetical protein